MSQPSSHLQRDVEVRLARHLRKAIACLERPDLPARHRELLLGTLAYLLEEVDLVPDNTPHIGLLDDLMVFVMVASQLNAGGHQLSEIWPPGELDEDQRFIKKNEGLIFGVTTPDPEVIRKLARKHAGDPQSVIAAIRRDFASLLTEP